MGITCAPTFMYGIKLDEWNSKLWEEEDPIELIEKWVYDKERFPRPSPLSVGLMGYADAGINSCVVGPKSTVHHGFDPMPKKLNLNVSVNSFEWDSLLEFCDEWGFDITDANWYLGVLFGH